MSTDPHLESQGRCSSGCEGNHGHDSPTERLSTAVCPVVRDHYRSCLGRLRWASSSRKVAAMGTSPERIDPRDVMSRSYWSQLCPNFSNCNTSDAQGKACSTCGTELPGFIADLVECPECDGRRFYCGPDSRQLPGQPDLRCFSCDAAMSY